MWEEPKSPCGIPPIGIGPANRGPLKPYPFTLQFLPLILRFRHTAQHEALESPLTKSPLSKLRPRGEVRLWSLRCRRVEGAEHASSHVRITLGVNLFLPHRASKFWKRGRAQDTSSCCKKRGAATVLPVTVAKVLMSPCVWSIVKSLTTCSRSYRSLI